MRQGLCNGTVSVSLSVPSIERRSPSVCLSHLSNAAAAACGGFAAVGPAGGLLHSAPFDAHPQQHSGQQQMRAVPYCQPTYEAEHRLVIKVLSITGKWLIFGEVMC